MTIAGASIITLLWMLLAGVGAGFVGYAVGASSLVSYPAMLALGVPPVLANTTNTVGVLGTGIGGCISARRELTGHRGRVIVYAIIGVAGGSAGGILLLDLPPQVFEYLVPPLILLSAAIIALNPRGRIHNRMHADAVTTKTSIRAGDPSMPVVGDAVRDDIRKDPWWMWFGMVFVSVYSGYFGAGAGTLALAMLDLGRIGPFVEINALKIIVGFGANVTASIMFIARGSVNWPFAIALGIGCFIGSYIAPPIVRRIPENIMRAAAVLAGVILAAKLGWSTYF